MAGGRWNSKGAALLYTSSSRALCLAEVLVHQPLGKLPTDFWLLTIELPDEAIIERFDVESLPKSWDSFVPLLGTQILGDQFVKTGKSLGFWVPSAVVKGDLNCLLNPKHPDFSKVQIASVEPFQFDERLFKR